MSFDPTGKTVRRDTAIFLFRVEVFPNSLAGPEEGHLKGKGRRTRPFETFGRRIFIMTPLPASRWKRAASVQKALRQDRSNATIQQIRFHGSREYLYSTMSILTLAAAGLIWAATAPGRRC